LFYALPKHKAGRHLQYATIHVKYHGIKVIFQLKVRAVVMLLNVA